MRIKNTSIFLLPAIFITAISPAFGSQAGPNNEAFLKYLSEDTARLERQNELLMKRNSEIDADARYRDAIQALNKPTNCNTNCTTNNYGTTTCQTKCH